MHASAAARAKEMCAIAGTALDAATHPSRSGEIAASGGWAARARETGALDPREDCDADRMVHGTRGARAVDDCGQSHVHGVAKKFTPKTVCAVIKPDGVVQDRICFWVTA